MSTDNTLISREMALVRDQGDGAHYLIRVQLLVNKQWLTPLRLDQYSLERNYEESFTDTLVLSFMMLLGTYTFDLLPYGSDITVDVTYVPVGATGAGRSANKKSVRRRYKGILMDPNNAALTTNVSNAATRAQLDTQAPMQVQMQLVEEAVYDLVMRSYGSKFRNMTTHEILMAVLTLSTTFMTGKDESRILGVNTRGITNPERRTQVTIPHGTPYGKVANLLQNKEGGVFAAGLGAYLQNQYWYVFPLYDVTHSSKQRRSITVYCVPTDRYDGTERTYRTTDNRLVILAAGNVSALKTSDGNRVQAGNGVRFLDARKVLQGFAVSKENRMMVDRATNVFEVTSKKITEEVNNIQWSAQRVSANPFAHYSAMARMDGQVAVVEWRHGDADLLEPGDLVEFYAIAESKIKLFKGVLLGTHESRVSAEPGLVVTRHPGVVVLKIFLENPTTTTTGA